MVDEAELWARACADDGGAFAALFDLHHAQVYRRAIGLLGDRHDADDVAAAAFFELWRKRRSVRVVSGSVLPWLLVTTVNLSRNVRRNTARYRQLLRGLPHADAVPAPDGSSIDLGRRLADTLARLAPVDSALFVLTALDELSITQAAEVLGLTPANARVRLHRARARLKGELHDLDPRPNQEPVVERSTS